MLDCSDWSDALSGDVNGLKVGICRNHSFEGIVPEVADAVENAITSLARNGARISEFTVPDLYYGLGAIFAIELASSTNYHDQRLRTGSTRDMSLDVRLLVETGRLVTVPDYLQAERYSRQLSEQSAAIVPVAVPLANAARKMQSRTDELSNGWLSIRVQRGVGG